MQYVKIDPEAPDLGYAHWGDAGIDLTARQFICLSPFGEEHDKFLMPTGIAVAIPQGYFGMIVPRSSSAKLGIMLANTMGIIDSGYRGELLVYIRNMKNEHVYIDRGMRIAQLVIVPFCQVLEFVQIEELSETSRGDGRFGSTGQ